MFTNHDPINGRTLYGAEIIVDPALQGHGIGSRLWGTHQAVADYVLQVVQGLLWDRTLSVWLHEGCHVLAVVPHYLSDDPETLGYAAVTEWLNPQVAQPEHYAGRPTDYLHPAVKPPAPASPPAGGAQRRPSTADSMWSTGKTPMSRSHDLYARPVVQIVEDPAKVYRGLLVIWL